MIPALYVAAKRRVLCLLGRHDWTPCEMRPATYWYFDRGKWCDSGIRMGGYLGSRICCIAGCQRVEIEVAKNRWVSIFHTTPLDLTIKDVQI